MFEYYERLNASPSRLRDRTTDAIPGTCIYVTLGSVSEFCDCESQVVYQTTRLESSPSHHGREVSLSSFLKLKAA